MKTTTLPNDKIEPVKHALKETFETAEADHIELMDGGLSSSLNYRVIIDRTAYVLRIIKNISPLNDPSRRFRCMQLAADAGISPKVYYANSEEAISIVAYIDAQPVRKSFSSSERLLKNLTALIRNIHALPEFPTLINFLDGVDLFISQFKELQMFPEEVTREVFDYYAEIQAHYPRQDTNMVASHNDLHAQNILYDGQKLWVIDWEAAFQNDRYADLAIVAKSFVAGESQEEAFLTYYFGDALNDYKKARYYLMQQVCHMYYAMLMFKFATTMRSPDYKHNSNMDIVPLRKVPKLIENGELSLYEYEGRLLYGKALLNEALKNMKRKKFNESITKVLKGDCIEFTNDPSSSLSL